MHGPILQLSGAQAEALWTHLLSSGRGTEEVAFLFAHYNAIPGSFRIVDWYPVPPDGFKTCSAWDFELRRETQGAVIKRAHDLGTGLIEVHSHDDPDEPVFSPSDLYGFREFVPHVWWRLKRPYGAVVIAQGGLDGLVWIDGPDSPQRLEAINVEGRLMTTSKRSQMRWANWMDRYSNE